MHFSVNRIYHVQEELKMKRLTLITLLSLMILSSGLIAGKGESAFGTVYLDNLSTGEPEFLKEHISKGPLILSFWATYCVPCAQEMPELQKLATKHSGVTLIFVNIDESKNLGLVKQRVKEWGVTQTVLMDKFQITVKKYTPKMKVPSTFLIKDGNIAYSSLGYNEKTIAKLEKEIQKLK